MGKATSNLAGGIWHATTERIPARKSHLQMGWDVAQALSKIEFLGCFLIFFPTISNMDYYVERKKKKRCLTGQNISLGDTGGMLFEVRTFSLCLSHTQTHTHNQLALWVIHMADAQLTLLYQEASANHWCSGIVVWPALFLILVYFWLKTSGFS